MQDQLRKAVRRHKWATKLKNDAFKTEIARDIFKPVMRRHVAPLLSLCLARPVLNRFID